MATVKAMTTVKVLTKARDLIARPDGWTRRTYARNASGRSVTFTGKAACQFCAVGAIRRVAKTDWYGISERYLAPAVGAVGICQLTQWNDDLGRMQTDVIRAFERAIILAKNDGDTESEGRDGG